MERKTGSEYKIKSLSVLLKSLTSISILIATLMIVGGLAGYWQYHSWSSFLEPGHRFMFTPSLMVAVLGTVLMAVTCCGFVGTWKLNCCLLTAYALITVMILFAQLVAVILSFTMNSDTLAKFITIPVWEYANDKELEAEIDKLQTEMKCCGSTSYTDYLGVNYTAEHNYRLYQGSVLVPATCCCCSTEETVCGRVYAGCSTVFVDMIYTNLNCIGVLGVSVMFVQVLAILLAVLLAHSIRTENKHRALLELATKEQIMKQVHVDCSETLQYGSL